MAVAGARCAPTDQSNPEPASRATSDRPGAVAGLGRRVEWPGLAVRVAAGEVAGWDLIRSMFLTRRIASGPVIKTSKMIALNGYWTPETLDIYLEHVYYS